MGSRPSFLLAALLALATLPARGDPRRCADPQALGTSRELAVGDGVAVGLKTYPRTLDLAPREVVLTFDDGPARATTPRILDALDAACVRATFFLVGRNAAALPAIVRREVALGHSVGHHTWSHPAVTLRGLGDAEGRAEIARGMEADDKAAYGAWSGAPRVPFFRFPGFADTKDLLDGLKARRIAVFGADLWAADWVPMTPEVELRRLMARLDAAGGGIVLLHDTKEQTAAMLPALLAALKAGGYRVVHLVPGPHGPAMRAAPAGWTPETERAIAHAWPRITRAAAHAGADEP